MNTATLITLFGDKVSIKHLDPITVGIWRLDINATAEMLTTRFIFWLEECSKKLHVNGHINLQIVNPKNQLLTF